VSLEAPVNAGIITPNMVWLEALVRR
jgi:hypothetical protein